MSCSSIHARTLRTMSSMLFTSPTGGGCSPTSNTWSRPAPRKWPWASMKPGRSAWSPRSTTRVDGASSAITSSIGPAATMVSPRHCDRFHGGTSRVHGDDVVAVEDRVRRVGFLSTTRENHGKNERENDKGLIRPAHNSLHNGQGLMWAAYGCASRPVKPPPSPGAMYLRGNSWSWPLPRWEPSPD